MHRAAIGTILPNPSNPRIIKDYKFKKLVKSIEDFPQMLELRPIVVDSNMVVLGGNMRLRACIAAGLKEVPIIIADQLTDIQKNEFIIKDNVGFGEWDWDQLANQWDMELLSEWGMDVPYTEDEIEEMGNPVNDNSEKPFALELDSESNYLVLKFNTDIDWIQAKTIFELESVASKRANGKAWSIGIGRVIDGVEAIKRIQGEN
jgi:ParB-like chromosome segregation protein Spo0J